MPSSGGDFYGEGTYGCTFSPPPQCTSHKEVLISEIKKQKDKLAKVFQKQASSTIEWDVAKRLKSVDPKQQYFLFPFAKCQTSLAELTKDPQFHHCSYKNKKLKQYPMVIMKKGGTPLDSYMAYHKVSVQEFAKIILQVLKGIKMLNQHNLIHHDLKFDNILYNASTDETRIIDFGLLLSRSDALNVFENMYIYSDYWLHPPEYRIIQYIHALPNLADATNMGITNTFEKNVSILNVSFFSKQPTLRQLVYDIFPPDDFKTGFEKYMHDVCKKNSKDEAFRYMSKYSNRIDIYSLGISSLYLSTYITFPSVKEKKQFMAFLKGMIHPDPRKRFTVDKAIKMLQSSIK
jgi:serine/threonine protein kinase